MATIAIAEPQDEVRDLFALVVERLGHEPLDARELQANGSMAAVDVLLLEPADPEAMQLARRLRRGNASLPLICASIYPQTEETRQLDAVAFLPKPFNLSVLEAAVRRAVDLA